VSIVAVLALAVFGAAPALAATAGPPTGVVVSAGDGQASVDFTPPSSAGDSPITQYTVTASPGGMTASASASPVAISGLTDGTPYTFTVAAVNSSGAGPASSASLPATPLATPSATYNPQVLGSALVGQTLFATNGSWTEPSQLSYQWLDCNASGGSCFVAPGASTGFSYTVTPLDGGHTIVVAITAVNADNEYGSARSAPTLAIVAAAGAPVVQSAPALSAASASEPLTATSGTWSGAPTGYSYEWYACSPAPGSCDPVTVFSSLLDSFSPGVDEDGESLEVAVVATNASGSSAAAFSAPSAPISFPPPTISISWPADGADYSPSLSPGAADALYSCTAAGGATIVSCVGTVASGSAVPFSLGSHTFTVTATDSAGQSVTRTVNYAVGGDPSITLTGPGNGATYTQGTPLSATATCAAFDGSSLPCALAQAPQPACQSQGALVGCADATQGAGPAALDTQDLGRHTVTVTATDAFGESASLLVSYTVVAAPPSVSASQDASVTITRLSQSSPRWRIGGGTRFSFTPNEAAVVTFVFQREANGRRAAGRCVAQSAANLHEPACTRTLRAGSLRRYEPAGTDVVAFDGRVGGSSLAPGSYGVLVSATAIGAPAVVSTAGPLRFTIAG